MNDRTFYPVPEAVWFSSLPETWQAVQMRQLFSERSTKVSDKDYAPLTVGYMGVVPQLANVAKTDNGDNRKLIKKGDFAINSRSDRKGAGGISEYDGSCSVIITVLKPHKELNGRFYHYLLRSHYFSEEFYRNGYGIVDDLWSTKWKTMRTIYLPVPPREEQDQIVRFLDWKVSEINRLIAVKKKILASIDEKFITDIAWVMSHGLNSNNQIVHTNNQWIRCIPKHWRIASIRRNYTSILGKMLSDKANDPNDSFESYFCAKDVHFDSVDKSSLKKMWFSNYEKQMYLVKDGDLLIVEGGAGAGGCAVVQINDNEKIYIQNSIHLIRPKHNEVNNKFLCYWMRLLQKRGYISYICNVATIPHFTKEKVLSTDMPVPPKNEQEAIVAYLDKTSAIYSVYSADIQKQISNLEEIKKRIISDVVTGQIDVRNIEIPEFEYVEETADAPEEAEPDDMDEEV